jgi:hypothetical protein
MSERVSRRKAVALLAGLALLPALSSCEKSPTDVKKAARIVIAVAKKFSKVVSVGIDLVELALEIKAIIEGKEETIQARITAEERDALKNGGQLIIKDKGGREFPVSYTPK